MSDAERLQNHPDPEDLATPLRSLGTTISYAKDKEIFGQGEPADRVYLVLSGVVRTTRVLCDGRRQVGGFYYAGDLIGVEHGPVHRFAAEAVMDAALGTVGRASLKAIGREAELERLLWDATRRELERAQDHLELLARKSARERVARFLVEIAQRDGSQGALLPMSRQDIGDYLGLTIETVSRMLTQLQSGSVVQFESHRRFTIKKHEVLAEMVA